MSSTTNLMFQTLLHRDVNRKNDEPYWLKERRDAAFSWVSKHGFPTQKDDAWKYTWIAPILNTSFKQGEARKDVSLSSAMIDQLAGNFGGPRLIFMNGHFIPQISSLTKLPQNIEVKSLSSAINEEDEFLRLRFCRPFQENTHAFTALNTACTEDGAFIKISTNGTIEEPIHLVFLSDVKKPTAVHPRSLIHAGAHSQVTIIETYAGISGDISFTNAITEIVLDEGAMMNHYKIQNEAETAFHIGLLDVQQGKNSQFTTHAIEVGSKLARNEIKIKLQSPGASSMLNGLYMPISEQVLDNSTTIEHTAPHCTSRELYKGVVDKQGRGIFDGQILVGTGAAKTDASLINKTLLLSESAQSYTRPLLKIFTDDVKCSHGATVGQLNKDSIFYLRSRGIPKETVQRLLIYAFVSEMLELIRLEPLRAYVKKKIMSRISISNEMEVVT